MGSNQLTVQEASVRHEGEATVVDQMTWEPEVRMGEREAPLSYSAKVTAEASNPKNMGRMVEADVCAIIHGCCGDTMEIYLQLDGERIEKATFMTDGREPAVAGGSVLTTLVRGMSLEEAAMIRPEDLIATLGGLPEMKTHCASLTVNALREAIADWHTEAKP
jgi:NifU-like protein involved in Fe-S cluster formation